MESSPLFEKQYGIMDRKWVMGCSPWQLLSILDCTQLLEHALNPLQNHQLLEGPRSNPSSWKSRCPSTY